MFSRLPGKQHKLYTISQIERVKEGVESPGHRGRIHLPARINLNGRFNGDRGQPIHEPKTRQNLLVRLILVEVAAVALPPEESLGRNFRRAGAMNVHNRRV